MAFGPHQVTVGGRPLVAPALATALLLVPGVAVRSVSVGWANLFALAAALVALPAGPFLHAGAVGLADAVPDGGDPWLRTFLDAGWRGYLPTLVGSLAAVAALSCGTVVLAPAATGTFPGPAPVGAAVLVAVVTACGGVLVTLSTAYYRATADTGA